MEDYATEQVTDDGRRFVVCTNRAHGPEPWVWEVPARGASRPRGDGLGAELDIWDKLLDCIPSGGAVHSYGYVEDRFFGKYPSEANLLQERYGHKWREGKASTNQFSVSAFLAARLSELADEGVLEKTFAPPPEPEWSHLEVISHWRQI